ncbi:MAG: lamin tail domain-containing protein [Myxococcales bacterium]|nr:lamin tail domain-containing protein [Myxococcales bacterium]
MATDGPLPDLGPDAAIDAGADLGADMAVECAEDIDCAVDAVCGTGRCVEGRCVGEPVEGCCEGDEACGDGEVCDLDSNTCVPAPTPIRCRYVGPTERTSFYDVAFPLYGQLYIEGVTDASAGVDPVEGLVVQGGYGPVGAGEGDPGFVWVPAEADPAWDDLEGAAPGYDQYVATAAVPAPGEYALAFRAAFEGGAFVWCDLDGSENGFDPAETGTFTAEPGACDGSPCAAAPAASCEGDVAVRPIAPGECTVTPEGPECSYDETREDCAALGGRCDAGACVDLPVAPGASELVISEIMYDAIDPLADADAEWIELYNPSDRRFTLAGCELYDGGDNSSLLDAFFVEPGAYVLLALTDDVAVNGGITPDLIFGNGVRLGNEGELLGLRCNGVVVDTVDYGAPGFPPSPAAR